MKYSIKRTKLFRKQYKLLEKRGSNMVLLDNVILMLACGKTYPNNITTTLSEVAAKDLKIAIFKTIGF